MENDNQRPEKLKDTLRVFVVPADIFDVPDLDWKEQMAYIVLRSFANAQEGTAFPSYKTIAKKGRMSRDSAIRAVDSLIEKGLLHKKVRLDVSENRKIKNTSNLYTIYTPKEAKSKQGSSREQLPPLVAESDQGSSREQLPLVAESDQGSSREQPEHNHLTELNKTILINNNIDITSKQNQTEKEQKKDVVVDVLNQFNLPVSQQLLNTWRSLEKDELIIQAIKEAVNKKGIENVIGYITRMLENGYTPSVPTKSKENKQDQSVSKGKTDLVPHWVANQKHSGKQNIQKSSETISIEDQKAALELMFELKEIPQEEYEARIKKLDRLIQDR